MRSEQMKKVVKIQQKERERREKEEREAKKREVEELVRKKAQQEKEEQEAKEREIEVQRKREEEQKKAKEEKEWRANVRNVLVHLKKLSGATKISDEQTLRRKGFSFTRIQVASGKNSKIYRAKHKDNEHMVVKVVMMSKDVNKEKITGESSQIIRFICGAEGGEPKSRQFLRVYEIFATSEKLYIFMDEYFPTSLRDRIKSNERISEEDAKKWCQQIVEGLKALHDCGVAHRNLRPEHILIDKESKIKIVGLEMMCIFWDPNHDKVLLRKSLEIKDKKDAEKFNHLPPEAFREGNNGFDPSLADVWSLGLIICLLLTKKNPFNIMDPQKMEQQWKSFAESGKIPQDAKQLLDRIFVNIDSRVNLNEIMADFWFSSNSI